MYVLAMTTLLLTPWHGKDLQTATAAASKYRLTIHDRPGSTVHLRATRVAAGWIAAFCDERVCSPMHVSEQIPKSGRVILQFELIREDDSAAHQSGAVIMPYAGKPVVVPQAKG